MYIVPSEKQSFPPQNNIMKYTLAKNRTILYQGVLVSGILMWFSGDLDKKTAVSLSRCLPQGYLCAVEGYLVWDSCCWMQQLVNRQIQSVEWAQWQGGRHSTLSLCFRARCSQNHDLSNRIACSWLQFHKRFNDYANCETISRTLATFSSRSSFEVASQRKRR